MFQAEAIADVGRLLESNQSLTNITGFSEQAIIIGAGSTYQAFRSLTSVAGLLDTPKLSPFSPGKSRLH